MCASVTTPRRQSARLRQQASAQSTPVKSRVGKGAANRSENSSPWIRDERFLDNLRYYRYQSEDDSILTRLFLNRHWTWLSKFLPPRLAPNAITLIGLTHVISAFLLCCWYRPGMEGGMPGWVYGWIAWSIWAYTTLDALDGKQARRTGSSSPLGELFDHGCDCCNLVFMAFITLAMVDMPLGPVSMAAICSAMVAFYVVTWEEYHTGILYLSYLSGPVEGAFIVVACALLSSLYGKTIPYNAWQAVAFGRFPSLSASSKQSARLWGIIIRFCGVRC